jgi:hypothetical protein
MGLKSQKKIKKLFFIAEAENVVRLHATLQNGMDIPSAYFDDNFNMDT